MVNGQLKTFKINNQFKYPSQNNNLRNTTLRKVIKPIITLANYQIIPLSHFHISTLAN